MISISKEEYNELMKDSAILNALRNSGVDNWDGYDYDYGRILGEGK